MGPDPPPRIAAEIEAALGRLPRPRAAAVRALRRSFSKRLAPAGARLVLETARRLLGRDGILRRFVAYELVSHHHAAARAVGARELAWLGRGLDSWGAVDGFALYLAGPAWREGQVPDALIHRWARSSDRWWRRAALVSTVALNTKARGGRGDPARTLAVCRLLVRDRDDMVVKALSWALRELAKREAGAVRRFLREQEAALAARVKREVANKLATGLKNPARA